MNAKPIDSVIRDQIISDIQDSHFISAGAGAGKSTSIVSRIINVICNEDPDKRLPINQIVAVTFTEKAAKELRHKLRSKLEKVHRNQASQETSRALAEKALQELDSAAIGTIHSFALGLLRQYPLEAGLPLGFSVVDAGESKRAARQLAQDIVSQLYSTATSESIQLLSEYEIELRHILDLVTELQATHSRHSIEGFPEIEEAQLRDYVTEFAQTLLDWWTQNNPQLNQSRKDGVYFKLEPPFSSLQLATENDFKTDDLIRACLHIRECLGRTLGSGVEKEIIKNFKSEFSEDFLWFADRNFFQLEQLVAGWLRIAFERVRGDYKSRTRAGAITFDDLLLLAHDLVVGESTANKEIRAQLYRKYKFYVVDEFQDTDPVQWNMIRSLTTLPDNQNAAPEQGRLVVVGDPKQSIYKFRGADISVYEGVRKEAESTWGDSSLKSLVANFRSRPSILKFVHRLYEIEEGVLGTVFEPMHPEVPVSENEGVFVLDPGNFSALNKKDPDYKEKIKPIERAEREAVAAVIQEAVSSKTISVYEDGKETVSRQAVYSDIALLMPFRTKLAEQLQLMDSLSIPYKTTDSMIVYQRPSVRGLVAAIRVLAGSINGRDLWWTLKSPLFGLNDNDLLSHKESGNRWPAPISQFKELDSAPQSNPIVSALAMLREFSESMRDSQPSEILEALYEKTSLHQSLDQLRTGTFEKSCVMMLILHAKQWEASGGSGLLDYLDWIDQMEDENVHENLPTPDMKSFDAVTISTIHSAKGLEYPIVILTGMQNTVRPRLPKCVKGPTGRVEFQLNLSVSRPGENKKQVYSLNYRKHCFESQLDLIHQENRRLLYVAATRAQHYLYYSTHHLGLSDGELSDSPWSKYVRSSVLLAAGEDLASVLPEAALKPQQTSEPWVRKQIVSVESTQTVDKLRSSIAVASKSTTKRPSDGGKVAFYVEGFDGAAAYGSAFHAVMESLSRVGFDPLWPKLETCINKFAMEFQIIGRSADLLVDVRAALQTALIDQARVSKNIKAEQSLSGIKEGKMIVGSADLFFEDSNGGIVVVDYKTNSAMPPEVMEKYQKQLADYKYLLESATGKPVVQKVLLHVTKGVAQERPV